MLSLEKATELDQFYTTLEPNPLMSAEEIERFYVDLEELRGEEDRIEAIGVQLRRKKQQAVKTLLMSHSGTGKSTEITRLKGILEEDFKVLRFSATEELDALNFKAFDILILIVSRMVEETKTLTGKHPGRADLEAFLEWFATESVVLEERSQADARLEAGAGASEKSLWDLALGLFVKFRGEMRFTTHRNRRVTEYRMQRISQLVELANRLVTACNALLEQHCGKRWLIIGEDFDKPRISVEANQEFFVNYARVITELKCHLFLILPIYLGYSVYAENLPVVPEQITNIPVYTKDHRPHEAGRGKVREILACRVDLNLFDEGVVDRFITASGGNLRDIFRMVLDAADTAALKGEKTISMVRAEQKIHKLRKDFERRLGEFQHDPNPIPFDEKASKLVAVYKREESAEVPDKVLYALLQARAIQEFNGTKWFGVHPLVVDLLVSYDRIKPASDGMTGGSRG